MVRNLLMAKIEEINSRGPARSGIKVESYGNYEFTQKRARAVLRVQVYGALGFSFRFYNFFFLERLPSAARFRFLIKQKL